MIRNVLLTIATTAAGLTLAGASHGAILLEDDFESYADTNAAKVNWLVDSKVSLLATDGVGGSKALGNNLFGFGNHFASKTSVGSFAAYSQIDVEFFLKYSPSSEYGGLNFGLAPTITTGGNESILSPAYWGGSTTTVSGSRPNGGIVGGWESSGNSIGSSQLAGLSAAPGFYFITMSYILEDDNQFTLSYEIYDAGSDGTTALGSPLTSETLTDQALPDLLAADDLYYFMQGTNATIGIDNLEITGTLIPEPASLAMLAAGGLMMLRRRK